MSLQNHHPFFAGQTGLTGADIYYYSHIKSDRSLEHFAKLYGIYLGTVKSWEQPIISISVAATANVCLIPITK